MAHRYGYDKHHPLYLFESNLGVEVNDMGAIGEHGGCLRPIPPDVWRDLVVGEYRDIYWREKHSDLTWGEFNERFPLEAFPLP